MGILATKLVAGGTCVLSLSATYADPGAAQQWFQAVVESSEAHFADRSFKVQYRVVSAETADPGEIAAIRQRVEGLPDHPEHARLQQLELLLKRGPGTRTVSLWFNHGECRLNRDTGKDDYAEYVDIVNLKDAGWKLSPNQLFLLPPAASVRSNPNPDPV